MNTRSKLFHILLFAALITSLFGAAVNVTLARAFSTITVNTNADELNNDGDCSLREAIQAANTDSSVDACSAGNGADTIIVPSGIYQLSIPGAFEFSNATGDLDITDDVNIQGAGASTTIIEAGATLGSGIDRVLYFEGVTASISGVTIANGDCPACIGGGILNSGGLLTVSNSVFSDNNPSGIFNENSGAVIITNSTFSDNSSDYGGGLDNSSGSVTVSNSTFVGNTASQWGGGINNNIGTVTIRNSTFSGNTATARGAGIENYSGATLDLANTIVVNSTGGVDCRNDGSITGTDPNNLIEVNGAGATGCGIPTQTSDAGIATTLADNGGPTKTLLLGLGSPAINGGDDATCAATDQRGVARPKGAHCDIGAYEVAPSQTGPIYLVNTYSDNYDGLCDTISTGVGNQGCSLRDAITTANQNLGADTITVPADTNAYKLTLVGAGEDQNATGDLDILDDLTINGGGASTTIIEAGATGYPGIPDGVDRVMQVAGGKSLTLSGVTIANGACSGVACNGGGIDNHGTLNVTDSVFSGNWAGSTGSGSGGGIMNNGATLTMMRVTFSNNTSGTGFGNGGGIDNDNASVAVVTNSTFSNNDAGEEGGGIDNYGTLTARNTTFSGNTSAASGNGGGIYNRGTLNLSNTMLANSISSSDCYNDTGSLSTNVKNLIEANSAGGNACGTPTLAVDPNLDSTLALNGGSTPNFALLTGSPAIDAGDPTTCSSPPVNGVDQRGKLRPAGVSPKCDIGAYEAPITKVFKSAVAQDGWVLESSETSNHGGTMDSAATTFRLGDDASKKQYRGVLSFATGALLPDNAVISQVTLKLKKQAITGGGNPVTTFQGFMLDVKKGTLGTSALQTTDFQTSATHSYGPFLTALSGGFYTIDLTSGAGNVNKLSTSSGLTQIRVRFTKDDDNNTKANYLSLYSGNMAASAPVLSIQYYIP